MPAVGGSVWRQLLLPACCLTGNCYWLPHRECYRIDLYLHFFFSKATNAQSAAYAVEALLFFLCNKNVERMRSRRSGDRRGTRYFRYPVESRQSPQTSDMDSQNKLLREVSSLVDLKKVLKSTLTQVVGPMGVDTLAGDN